MATANMGMTLPVVGVTSDAVGEGYVVANFGILDVHDHSSGKGAQVVSAGININADLSFAGFRPFNLGSATFVNQTGAISTSNKPCFYVLNGEAHFIDNSGNDVALTASGSVAGATGSISGLIGGASASFSVNTFTWRTNGTTFAKMNNADITLYQASAGITNGITLKSPNSLAASYTVTLPGAAPGTTQYLNMDSGGTIATATADTIAAGMTATGANAIRAVSTRATGTSVAAGGVAVSASATGASAGVATYTTIAGLSVTLTTSGRPIFVGLISDASGTPSLLSCIGSSPTSMFRILEGANTVAEYLLEALATNPGSYHAVPSSCLQGIYFIGAGTYTFTVQAKESSGGGGSATVGNAKLVAYEL